MCLHDHDDTSPAANFLIVAIASLVIWYSLIELAIIVFG